MSLVRRSFAAISALLLLQLMLLGSGTLCTMHGGRTSDAAMPMAGMTQQTGFHESNMTRSSVSDVPMSPADCGDGGDQGGCSLLFAPGQCSSMTTCTISATPATTIAASEYSQAGMLAVPSYALGHSGPTFAPELPPPRA
jgi:hypothetical protein